MAAIEVNEKCMDLDILPYPAQVTVIKHLYRSSTDVVNLGKAFPTFAPVAHLTKTTWIFDKIFPILVRYLPRNDAIKCRLVCHSWMEAVDIFFQTLGIGMPEPDYGEPERSLSDGVEHWSKDAFGLRSCWIETAYSISEFMKKMDTHPRNPFISRCVQICDQNDPRYWEEVARFLERFGNDIWKLRLGCYNSYPQATAIIRGVLELVPNVKMLSIEFNGIDVEELTEEEEIEIRRDLEENLYPPLPNLTHLDWAMCTDFYNAALPQYSEQLVHLKLMDHDFLDAYDTGAHGTFPNLKTLVVRIGDEAELFKLREMTGPLRSITTLCDHRISLHIYVEVFHTFARTLESFNVEYGEEPSFFQEDNFDPGLQHDPVDFPELKCVRFENPDPVESFDALLRLKPGPLCLRVQTFIKDWMEHYRDYQAPLFEKMEGEVIEIHGFLEKMEESKIWEMMPQLETFDVQAYDPSNRRIGKVFKRSELGDQRKN